MDSWLIHGYDFQKVFKIFENFRISEQNVSNFNIPTDYLWLFRSYQPLLNYNYMLKILKRIKLKYFNCENILFIYLKYLFKK